MFNTIVESIRKLPGLKIIEPLIIVVSCWFDIESRFTDLILEASGRSSKFREDFSESIHSTFPEEVTPLRVSKRVIINEAFVRHLDCCMESVGKVLEFKPVLIGC